MEQNITQFAQPNQKIAQDFVELLTGSPDTVMRLRFIHQHNPQAKSSKEHEGTISQLWPTIVELQSQRYGVFYCMNVIKSGLEGFASDKDVTSIRTLAVDCDNNGIPDHWHIQPSIIVHTSRVVIEGREVQKAQGLWPIFGLQVADFKQAQRQLAVHYDSDQTICNPSRVLRLPGTLHLKDLNRPQLVIFEDYTQGNVLCDYATTAEELLKGLPDLPAALEPTSAGSDISPDLPGNIERARQYLISRVKHGMVAIAGVNGDDHTYKLACEVIDLGVTPETAFKLMADHWNPSCLPPWDQFDLATKIENAAAYKQNKGYRFALTPSADTFNKSPWVLGYQAALASVGDPATDTDGIEHSIAQYPPPLSLQELMAGDFHRPSWLMEDVILQRHVNLLYGDGGVGKTTLALHMAAAIAAGIPLFGCTTQQAPALLALAEDDYGETKHRLRTICDRFGIEQNGLPLTPWCLPGHDMTLARVSDAGEITLRPFYYALKTELQKIGPGAFLVLDALADVAILSEQVRQAVNAFLKRVVTGLCLEYDASVLLLGHPSKSSLSDGSLYSGSTAFNNAVRVRSTLEIPGENEGDKAGTSRRLFKIAKSNYGAKRSIELFLIGGTVFVTPDQADVTVQAQLERDDVLAVVMKLIDKGIRIIRTNGAGQKPRDVAAQVRKDCGRSVTPKRVLEILNAAERDGVLRYEQGGSHRKAGFCRVGNDAPIPSSLVSSAGADSGQAQDETTGSAPITN